MIDNTLYHSMGTNVAYRDSLASAKDTFDMIRFDYIAHHIPSGKKFARYVWIYHISYSDPLLASWNYGILNQWHYTRLVEEAGQ